MRAAPARPFSPRRLVAWIVAAIIVCGTVWVSVPAAASTDTGDDESATGSVTWSVRPGDADGVDGRSWVEATLDPGQTVTEYLVIVNHSRRAATFALTAADGYFTDTGRFNMLPASRESTGAGTWIEVQDSVDLDAGETAVVPYTLTVPDSATPGDHPAGIAASIVTSRGTVGVESRVGFRVMTRVTGALHPALHVSGIAVYTGSLNPFEPGRLEVEYVVTNTGNIRLGAHPSVSTAALGTGDRGLAHRQRDAEPIAEFAPGEERAGAIELRAIWPLFVYTVEVSATAVAVEGVVDVEPPPPAVATVTVVAIPWPQLATLALGVLLALGWWRGRRRQRAELDRRIAQAREEGKREAAEAGHAVAIVAGVVLAASVMWAHLSPAPAVALVAHAETQDDGIGVAVTITPQPPDPSVTPAPSPTPDPSPDPTATPDPSATPDPPATPEPSATPDPTATPDPDPDAGPGGGLPLPLGVLILLLALVGAAVVTAAVLLALRVIASRRGL